MKRIIKGKMYNTEAAANVGCWDNGLYCADTYVELFGEVEE